MHVRTIDAYIYMRTCGVDVPRLAEQADQLAIQFWHNYSTGEIHRFTVRTALVSDSLCINNNYNNIVLDHHQDICTSDNFERTEVWNLYCPPNCTQNCKSTYITFI